MDPGLEASLADMTRSCLEGARQSIERLEGKDKIYMQTQLTDLRLWADSVGATAQAKASLDQRFQHQPEDVYLIRGLLSMLQGFFSECSIAADSKSDIKDIVSNIDSTIDSLAILGVQIRRSLREADNSFDKNREKYREFRAHLACIIASRPTEDGRPVDEGKEIHSVDYFANLRLTSVQERLIEANLRRRHRFLEAQRHSHGLKDISTKAYQSITPQQTIAEMPSSRAKQGANSNLAGNAAVTTQERQALLTVTSASGLDSKWGGLRDSRRPKSTVTRTTTITAAARYPKAHAPSGQKLIKCPCCCQAIPASEVEASQWKKHLEKDIYPYTCILENCPTPYNLFATHNEWEDHVMNDHLSQWHCPCCEDDAPVFESISGVKSHILSGHPDAVSDSSLEDLLSDAEIKVMGITECPLCGSEGPQDSPELVEHVLHHVHDFSLRSLPWPTDPPLSPSKPVATFDTDYATRLCKDDSGNEYSFSIAEWAESVAPKKGDSREISVVDSEGNELFLDMAKYPENITSGGPPLQLRDLDQNPPNISEVGSMSITEFNVDYFSENLYFKEESRDSRFSLQSHKEESNDSWSSSQSHQSSNATVNDALDELDLDRVPAHLKKVRDDWFVIFNQHVPRILDVDLIHTLSHETVVCCVRFSHDGKHVATGCDHSAQIYDVCSGEKVCVLQEDIDIIGDMYIKSVCFSPDDKYLATGGQGRLVRVWDIASRTIRNTFAGHEQDVHSLDFSRDGRTIASGSTDRTVRLWDIKSNTNILTLTTEDIIMSVAISSDTKYLAAGSLDRSVYVWDLHQGLLLGRFDGHGDMVYSIAFSPSSKELISGSLDRTIKTWEFSPDVPDDTIPKGGRCIKTFINHRDFVLSAAFTPDASWVISGSNDGSVLFLDPRTGYTQLLLQGHKSSVISVDPSPTGGFFATCSGDMKARIWSYYALAQI
ncbi:WD40-repeat-containing domain protein [Xylaria flabelliformis]|nr:WD40-repeat-containing domain protein [Xylaria flabelliformis]